MVGPLWPTSKKTDHKRVELNSIQLNWLSAISNGSSSMHCFRDN